MKPGPYTFVDATVSLEGARAGIIGLPWDGTASYRKGTAAGPDALREASQSIETYDPVLDVDIHECGPYTDFGNISPNVSDPKEVIDHIRASLAKIPEALPLAGIGGEHSVSFPLVERALQNHPDLFFMVFDAHADLRDEYEGTPFSHACVSRRVLDMIGPDRIAMFGVRSGIKEEFELMRNRRMIYPTTAKGMKAALKKAGKRPLYISVDVDGFDPSLLPGTGTVEPGGFSWADWEAMTTPILGHKIAGVDVVELAPGFDPTGRSTVIAARVLRTLLALLFSHRCTS